MRNKTLLKTGVVGSVIAAICCFTPVLVISMGALGLSAWLAWMDYVLFPALLIFTCIAAYAFMRMRRKSADNTMDDRS